MTAAELKGFLGSLGQRCHQSVTEGPWGSAVNWVKRTPQVSANMTQYRVDARNCEAKPLCFEAYVACAVAHVCMARQHGWRPARRCVSVQAGVSSHPYGTLALPTAIFDEETTYDHTTRACKLHSCALHGRRPASQFRTSRCPDGHGGHRPGALGRFPEAQPG
jgi:hypothetical protein